MSIIITGDEKFKKLNPNTMHDPKTDGVYNDLNLGFTSTVIDDLRVKEYDAICASIINILSTKKGDRVLSPNFGSKVHNFLFAELTEENGKLLVEEITSAISQEPRVELNNIFVFVDKENYEFVVSMFFDAPSLDFYNKTLELGIGTEGIKNY